MAPTLVDLPPETLLAVTSYLNTPIDYIHFLQSHYLIGRILHDREVLTKTLRRIASSSRECELASSTQISPFDALLCIYERQQALWKARPSSTIVLGDGQSFVYRQGIVAYTRAGLIRVLDVHNASHTEGVIYPSVIGTQLLGIDCRASEVELLHLQDGLLTVIYHGETRTNGWRSWILVINITGYEGRPLAVDLWTSEDVLVRNNSQYVCVVAPTGLSANGRHREWVCRVLEIDDMPVKSPILQIPELAIQEVGSALAFEVYDDFFYAISTQSTREMDEPEWVSHYTCFRFPLNHPDRLTLESVKLWRRHHREGPINDLWTDLQLVRDETTGELTIIEARKEWTEGSSTQRRTWYRQKLPAVFSNRNNIDTKDRNTIDPNSQNTTVLAVSQSEDLVSSSTTNDSPYLFSIPPEDKMGDNPAEAAFGLDQPPPHPRLTCNTHSEYSPTSRLPSVMQNLILAKSKYRTYISDANAFLDLVTDDQRPPSSNVWMQQLRLRIGSRKEASPFDERGMIHQHHVHPHTRRPIEGSELRYDDNGIHLWPPNDAPVVLVDLLHGSTRSYASCDGDDFRRKPFGDVTAYSDERSIIYLVKEKGAAEYDKGRLILINFDQYIQFWHKLWVPDFIDLYGHGVQNCSKSASKPTDKVAMQGIAGRSYESVEMDIDTAQGSDNRHHADGWDESQGNNSLQPVDEVNDLYWCEEFDDEPVDLHWFQEQSALWTDLQEGFCFT
ncbi:MAG: hypothetical protein Q9209_005665 [Squamulea sp. 1 TL-2023]